MSMIRYLRRDLKGIDSLRLPFSKSEHIQENKPSRHIRSIVNSRLAWLVFIVIISFWILNVHSTYSNYQVRVEQKLVAYEQDVLYAKRLEIEEVYTSIYEHIRTISLLPSIRRVGGYNRFSADENVVDQGRLSLDTHQTIQQIYRNLNINTELSEIYFILKGFDPDDGQVPFFMYDDAILGQNNEIVNLQQIDEEFHTEEYELDEYHHYQIQLAWYESHYPHWQDSNDITKIPAIVSPLLRTCDNTQYIHSEKDDVRNTNGFLYTVPVFSLANDQFTGIISAVLRANVLESILVGVPFIPLTEMDVQNALELDIRLPKESQNFLLSNARHDIAIYDRRNEYLQDYQSEIFDGSADHRVSSVKLGIVSDSSWTLYNYLTDQQISTITHKLNLLFINELLVRLVLLVILFLVFYKAARDQVVIQKQLFEAAHFDDLTQLPNRRLLYISLEETLKRAKVKGTRLGLMFLDIDDFGIINDTMSHRIGDQVLKNIAFRLRQKSENHINDAGTGGSKVPIAARLGGDDFALIFEDILDSSEGMLLGQQQMKKFEEPMVIEGQVFDVSLTGGMSVYPDDAQDLHELMASADYALRQAMDFGTGQFQMFNDEMRQYAARQNRLMRDLTDTIRTGGFSIQYQPKQSLGNDQVFSFEALMRWNHPELGFVSPVEFIPLLEQTGQIVEAGKWILEESCKQLKDWKKRGFDEVHVSVNVSAKQLLLSDMVQTVEKVLDDLDLAAHNLILEITESLMIDNLVDSSKILDRIRSKGVRLAIDDFGTGYSSLTYLQGLPIDYLKLDKSMIDVMNDARGEHVIRATIDLAHGLGLKTIAEGVEDKKQRDTLKNMGCDMIQGYLLTRPLPPAELDQFLVLSKSVVKTT